MMITPFVQAKNMDDMDRWLIEGMADAASPAILYHAQETARAGGDLADCPFEGDARRSWRWMFCITRGAKTKNAYRKLKSDLAIL